MNTHTKRTAAGLAALMLVTACSSGTDTGTVDSAVDDATAAAIDQAEDATDTTLSEENADAVAKMQTSMDLVSEEIQEADIEPDLAVAWTEIEARVTDAVETNVDVDESALNSMMDALESQLSLEANPEFQSAWADFRAEFDSFVASS